MRFPSSFFVGFFTALILGFLFLLTYDPAAIEHLLRRTAANMAWANGRALWGLIYLDEQEKLTGPLTFSEHIHQCLLIYTARITMFLVKHCSSFHAEICQNMRGNPQSHCDILFTLATGTELALGLLGL